MNKTTNKSAKLSDLKCPYEIATKIKSGDYTYQTVLNLASRLKQQNNLDYIIFSAACKEYTIMKKKAIKDFLEVWSNEEI